MALILSSWTDNISQMERETSYTISHLCLFIEPNRDQTLILGFYILGFLEKLRIYRPKTFHFKGLSDQCGINVVIEPT